MKKRYNRIIALVIAMMMALALIAACGGQGSTTPDAPAPAPAPAPDAPDAPAPAPEGWTPDPNQVLRFGTTGLDGFFNSIMASNVYDNYVCALVFETLVTNDASGMYFGYIADYTVSDDHLVYTFTLKDGVKFSDGTPMTSADVEFTYKTIAHPDYTGQRGYAVMDMVGYEAYSSGSSDVFSGIQVIDEKTISFTFEDGTASPANIESFVYGILPKHYYEFETWDDFLALNGNPLGSGWFTLEEYRDKEFVLLHKNINYWDAPNAASIDGVLMSEIPEESLQGAFQTGQLDLAQPQTSVDNWDAYTAMAGVTPLSILGNGYTFMCFNTTKPTLNDHLVRQALMYALDRPSFIEAVYGPHASVGLAPISPVSWAFPQSGINDYAFNMAKAEELMAEAGWVKGSDGILAKGGVKMEITWLVYTDVVWPGVLASMAADTWGQLGVDLTIDLMDFVTVGALTMDLPVDEREFDMYTMGWSTSIFPDLFGGIFGLDDEALGDFGYNASGWFDQDLYELMAAARQEFDFAKAADMYKELALGLNYNLPTAVVAYRNEMWVNSDRVNGLNISSYENWTYNFNKVTLS